MSVKGLLGQSVSTNFVLNCSFTRNKFELKEYGPKNRVVKWMVGYSRVLNKSRWLVKFAGYFTGTCHLLFFGNYPSLNRVFMCCYWIKRPKFNDVCVLFKQSVPECWKCIRWGPDLKIFHKLVPLAPASCTSATRFFLLQSFCHLLKILLKTLYRAGSTIVKGQKRTHYMYIVICLLIFVPRAFAGCEFEVDEEGCINSWRFESPTGCSVSLATPSPSLPSKPDRISISWGYGLRGSPTWIQQVVSNYSVLAKVSFKETCEEVLTFESVDDILWCYHSHETSSAVLSRGTIYLVCSSNFWFRGLNPTVLPFKWNVFSSTFTWYYLFSM